MKNVTKFQNRYRIQSNRLSGWDYSNEGAYFLTICTYCRECLFGEIVDHDMIMNDYGLLVQREWLYSGQLRSEIILGSYIVMPNHFHAIVHIVSDNDGDGSPVETHGRASLHRQPKSISSLMAGFKSGVTKQINIMRGTPNKKVWQANYYDHIIRNDGEYRRIIDYIEMNPVCWQSDSLR